MSAPKNADKPAESKQPTTDAKPANQSPLQQSALTLKNQLIVVGVMLLGLCLIYGAGFLIFKKYMSKKIDDIFKFSPISKDKSVIPFEELSGMEKVKEAFLDIIRQVKNRTIAPKDAFVDNDNWTRPFAIMLDGPPGSGKTTIAKSFAKLLGNDTEFALISYQNLASKWLGESEGNLAKVQKAIIKKARANPNKQFVVMFDELDSVARKTGSSTSEHTTKLTNTLKELLTSLEDCNRETRNITVIGATNNVNLIDPAILSRFRNTIHIPLPGRAAFASAIARLMQRTYPVEKLIGINYDRLGEIAADKNNRLDYRNLDSFLQRAELNYGENNWILKQNELEKILNDIGKAKKRVDEVSGEQPKN